VLTALDALEFVERHLHPPDLPALVDDVRDVAATVRLELDAALAVSPPSRSGASDSLIEAARHVCLAFELLSEAASDPKAFVQSYRAMREGTRALESLYPLASVSPGVNRFFIEPALRGYEPLATRLAEAGAARDGVGIVHVDNDRESRDGFSMYVPESYDPSETYPLVVALHGGSGHGADFLWTWLRDARSRGAILVAPTSRDRTWSLRPPDVDGPRIEALVAQVRQRWHVNDERILLTGMSDGATFTLIRGLNADSPFTHLAPCSASFHPSLVDRSSPQRLAGLPVYLMHGVLDWMFPVDYARIANASLARAGANVIYREIDDLSHNFPRDEIPRIMDWFLGPLAR
jgi:phospholipase/carboxylesterase